MAKIGIAVMSIAHQREFDKDSREDIVVNAVSTSDSLTNAPSRIYPVL